MSQEDSQNIQTVKGEVSVIEPQIEQPKSTFLSPLSSIFSSSPVTNDKPPSAIMETPRLPVDTPSVIQGTASVFLDYDRFSKNIKSYKFLQTPLISNIVKEIKELRLPLTSPYGITEQIPNLINPIGQNESNITEMTTRVTTKSDERLKDLNSKIVEYGFNFVPTITDVGQSIKDGIINEIENVNKTLELKFQNIIINKVNELRTETSKSYNSYLNDTLNLDKINTPGYYDSVIKIAKTIFDHKLKINGYLNETDNITDDQFDVLLRLNGIQFGSYFSNIKPADLTVLPGTIYIGKGKIKSRKSGTLFGYSEIVKDSFLNSDGSITDSNNQYTWEINYSQNNKLNFIGHKGGNFTRRNFIPSKNRTRSVSQILKSNRITKNKRSNPRKTRKSSN